MQIDGSKLLLPESTLDSYSTSQSASRDERRKKVNRTLQDNLNITNINNFYIGRSKMENFEDESANS